MNKHLLSKQKGAVLIVFAFLCLFILAVGGLIIDLSYLYKQKNDLQNEADLAALAGATIIYRGGTLTNFPNLSPDNTNFWSHYVTVQPSGVIAALNLYENTNTSLALTSNNTQLGPFNFNGKQVTVYTNGYNNLPTSCRNNSAAVTLSGNLPAVCVTISSPYSLFFNALTPTISATATSLTSFPAAQEPSVSLGVADCAIASGWNSVTNAPALYNGQPLTFTYNANSRTPTFTFRTSSGTTITGNCTGGLGIAWAYMKLTTAGGIPNPGQAPLIGVGDRSVFNTGFASSDWTALSSVVCTSTPCAYNLSLPIFSSSSGGGNVNYTNCINGSGTCGAGGLGFTSSDTTSGTGRPVVSFACVNLTSVIVNGQNGSSISGRFTTNCSSKGSGGGSNYYGILLDPKIAN